MPTHHKFFIFGILILILVSIPLTIYLIKSRQGTQSNAAAATIVSIVPPSKSVQVGDEFTMDVTVDPGGVNIISSMQLQLQYDPSVLQVESITPANPPFVQTLQGFQTSPQSSNIAFATITFGIGDNVTTAVQTATTAATIKFKAIAATTTPTTVTFVTGASGQTKVLSLATTDNPGENVLSSVNPASLTISGGSTNSTTPTPTTSPSPTQSLSNVTPTPTNLAPVCSSLNVDRALSGTAPYSLTFTANGYDSDGTVSKVSFDFGDGPAQSVTSGDGIGTNTVAVPLSHTYNNPGTYPATVTFTDNAGALSQSTAASCTKTVVVSAAQTGGNTGGSTGGSAGGSGSTGGSGNSAGTGGSSGTGTTTTPTPPVSGSMTTILGVIGGVAIVVVGTLLFAL